jgi:FKBP-type peptidyl-prolyl cis-trans isomerase FkpA
MQTRVLTLISVIFLGCTMFFGMANAGSPEENKAAGTAFLATNGKKTGVVTTASGLQYEVLTKGTGTQHPAASDTVKVHYKGTTIDGKEFDSSYSRGEPISFPLNGVIPGWTEGVQLMTEGAKYRFYIPSDLAYGENGAGGAIGPNETLIFDVELLKIN